MSVRIGFGKCATAKRPAVNAAAEEASERRRDDLDPRWALAGGARLQRLEGDVAGNGREVDVAGCRVSGREGEEPTQSDVDAADLAAGGGGHGSRIRLAGGRSRRLRRGGGDGVLGELLDRQAEGVERVAQAVGEAATDLAELGELLARPQASGLLIEALAVAATSG